MRRRLQRAAAIGMAALLCVQNAQFGLTTFADELSDLTKMEGIANAQEIRATSADAVKNLTDELDKDSEVGENGEIKENPDGNFDGQENEQDGMEKASDSDAEKKENSGIGNTVKKDETKKLQIRSFEWGDPEEYPKGEPMIASVTEETRASFEELAEALPQEIRAIVSEGENADDSSREEVIPIVSWSCPEYKTDEDGKWPLSGEFAFAAELPGEYEVAESCDAVEMTVILDGGVELLVEPSKQIMEIGGTGIFCNSTTKKLVKNYGSTEVLDSIIGTNYKVSYNEETQTYILDLQGVNIAKIKLFEGNWQFNVSGDNKIITDQQDPNPALIVSGGVGSLKINFENNSTLKLKGGDYGIEIAENTNILLDGSGTLMADTQGYDYAAASNFGILAWRGVTFYVQGNVNLRVGEDGASRLGIMDLRQDTKLIITTNGKVCFNNGLSLGANSNLTIGSQADVTINQGMKFAEKCSLSNAGDLKLNGGFTYPSITNCSISNSGKLSGTMDLGVYKQTPGMTRHNKTITISNSWKETGVDLQGLFETTPEKLPVEYRLSTVSASPDGAKIENGKLKITVPGTYYIQARVVIEGEKANFYQLPAGGTYYDTDGWMKDHAVVVVSAAELSGDAYQVIEYRGTYDGEPHNIAEVIYDETQVEFRGYRKRGNNSSLTQNCPQITNVSEVAAYVNTWEAVFWDDLNKKEITKLIYPNMYRPRLDNITIEIEYKGQQLDLNTPIELPCNSENQLPDTNDIKIYWYNENGVRKLVSEKDCQITFKQQEMIHVGDEGELQLNGSENNNNNFDYHREITLFKMVQRKVQLKATIPDKIYDGTKYLPDEERANVKLSIADPLNASEEKAGFKILGSVSYDSADVGQRRAKIYAIRPESSDYTCDYEQTVDAQIVKAPVENLEVTVSTYGTVYGRDLKVNRTITSKIKDEKAKTLEEFGAQFTYSLDGVTYMSLDALVPKLRVGSNEIHYRMTTTNYEDKEGTFTANVSKAGIWSDYFTVQVTGSQTYDGNGRALQITFLNDILKNDNPKVSYSLDPSEPRTYTEKLPELKDAGTYQVYYQITADNYYTYTSTTTVTVQIDKAPLTVTAGLKNPERGVIYGDPMPEFEASYTGFVNNETKETALTGTPVMTCSSYTPNSGAGTTHTINVEAGSGEGALSAQNYSLTFTQGSFTVNKKQAAIQVTNYDKWKAYTYDGKSPEIEAVVEGDEARDVKVEIYAGNPASGSALAEIPKNVGTYTAKFTAAETANYGAAETSRPFDIVQKGLKVTAVDQSITYGDPAPQYTAVYEGFAEGESLESLKGTLSFTCAYQQAKAGQSNENSNAGTYTITPAVAGLDNYEVTPVAGILTVGKKAPTFTDSTLLKEKYPDGSRVYDGTSVDLTPSTDGDGVRSYIVENTETGEVLTTDPVNVGTYKATYSVAEGTNYQAGSISYEFAITEAEMKNVTANGYDGIYDGHSHGIEVSVQDELVKDEVVEYGLEPDTYTGTDAPELIDAGTYTVYYQITAPNYKPYTGSAIVTITQKEIQVVTADQETTYLEEAPKFTIDSVKGMVGEETLENQNAVLSFVTAYTKGDDVGEYAVQAVVDGLKNYKVEVVPGTLKVQRRTPVFTDPANQYTTRVYDGKAVDLTPETDGDGTMSRVITNRETNEVLTSDPVDAGEYRVVYSVSEGKNYTEGSVSYDFAITQAPLVITAEDKNVVFGSKAPEYTVVYDGFVNGETEAVLTGTLVVTCDYTVEGRLATYEIIPSGLSAKNYAITWKNGVLTGRYPESDSDDYEETSKPANSKMPKSGTNNPGQGVTAKDAQKGYVNENSGIVSGKTLTEEMLTNNSESLNDGYSHWIKTDAGWWFRYADGSYPKAAGAANSGSGNSSAAQSYEWVQIDGKWWSFDSNGYLSTGWIFDPVYRNWFYMDVNTGMKTGWVLIDGKWYYFNPVSDGTRGTMFANRMTPDGWFVREDGSWDEKR